MCTWKALLSPLHRSMRVIKTGSISSLGNTWRHICIRFLAGLFTLISNDFRSTSSWPVDCFMCSMGSTDTVPVGGAFEYTACCCALCMAVFIHGQNQETSCTMQMNLYNHSHNHAGYSAMTKPLRRLHDVHTDPMFSVKNMVWCVSFVSVATLAAGKAIFVTLLRGSNALTHQ